MRLPVWFKCLVYVIDNIKNLIESIFDRTKRDTSPIWLASLHANANDFHNLVQQVIDNRHSDRLNEIGNTQTGTNPLHIAAFKKRIQIVMELIRLPEVHRKIYLTNGKTSSCF